MKKFLMLIMAAALLTGCTKGEATDTVETLEPETILIEIDADTDAEEIPLENAEITSKGVPYYCIQLPERINIRSSMSTENGDNIVMCVIAPSEIWLPVARNLWGSEDDDILNVFYMQKTWGGAYFDDLDRNWIIIRTDDVVSVEENRTVCSSDLYWYCEQNLSSEVYIATDVVKVEIKYLE